MSDYIEKYQRPRWLRLVKSDFRSVADEFDIMSGVGDSPVEDLFLTALHLTLKDGATVTHIGPRTTLYAAATNTLRVERQVPVGPYAADVVLTLELLGEPVARLAVEVDGREFHSAPWQVEHDKRRDRFFQAQGLPVFRFSGTEVTREGPACVAECLQMLASVAPRAAHVTERMLWLRERVKKLARLLALKSTQSQGVAQ